MRDLNVAEGQTLTDRAAARGAARLRHGGAGLTRRWPRSRSARRRRRSGVSLRRLLDERQAATLLIALLALVLVVIIALPLWTLLSKSFQDAERRLRRPRQLRHLLLDADAVRLALQQRLRSRRCRPRSSCRSPSSTPTRLTRSCMPAQGPVLRRGAAADLRALAAVGDLAASTSSATRASCARLLMGASIYGPIGIVIARGVLLLPARAADPRDRAGARRRAPLRGGRGARHDAAGASSGPSRCRARATA